MINRRNTLWLVPLALIVTFPLWKIPVADFLTPKTAESLENRKSAIKGYNFSMGKVTILQSEDGRETAVIHAKQAKSGKRHDEYILEEVDGDIIGDQGNRTNVKADTGTYMVSRKRLKLTGNVVIVNQADTSTLKTSLLYYHGKKRMVDCPEPTSLRGKGISVDGSSLLHDMKEGTYTVGGRVFCTLHGEESS